jgi:glycerophosphoryl diester phosphodiesterase
MSAWHGEIVGHRGAAGLAPENTIAAFEAGIAAGADRIEFDVRRTFDDLPVVFHDLNVDRFVPGARGRTVTRHLLEEMRRIDVGASLGRPGCFVPSLREVLEVLKDRVQLNLEVKGSGADGLRTLELSLPPLKDADLEDDTVLSSFHEPVVERMREAAPWMARALIVDLRFTGDPVAVASRLGCRALHAEQRLCGESLLARCRAADLELKAWTVNDEPVLRRLMDLGVDGLVSDYPDRVVRARGGPR